jgi:hypothetical protein
VEAEDLPLSGWFGGQGTGCLSLPSRELTFWAGYEGWLRQGLRTANCPRIWSAR